MAELTTAELVAIAKVLVGAGTVIQGDLRGSLIASGRSNLTVRLEDEVRAWVLRTPPRSGRTPSAHDVAREFRVVNALGPTDVPVPRAVVLCEDESIIGGAFAICEFVDGQTIQTQEQLAGLSDVQIDVAVRALARVLATIHHVDHLSIGLEGFGRPDRYAERQLRRWNSQWELVGSTFSAAVSSLAERLRTMLAERLPRQATVSIVHGDYRLDNTLVRVNRDEVTVAAVVDWELSTIGDPVADVASMCVYRDPVFDLVIGAPSAWTSGRLPDVLSLARAYEEAGGVTLKDFDQHLALAYYKLAVIAAGIDYRYRAGATDGAGFDTAGQAVPLLLERSIAQLRQ